MVIPDYYIGKQKVGTNEIYPSQIIRDLINSNFKLQRKILYRKWHIMFNFYQGHQLWCIIFIILLEITNIHVGVHVWLEIFWQNIKLLQNVNFIANNDLIIFPWVHTTDISYIKTGNVEKDHHDNESFTCDIVRTLHSMTNCNTTTTKLKYMI